MKSILRLLALVSVIGAAEVGDENSDEKCAAVHQWNYDTNHGEDWPTLKLTNADGSAKVNQCKKGTNTSFNQSPIDLRMDWPSKSAGFDNFNKLYQNQVQNSDGADPEVLTGVEVTWNGHTSQVSLTDTGDNLNTFQSTHGATTFGASTRWEGLQFHFHSLSEHTIEGKYTDLEMHTVHMPPHLLDADGQRIKDANGNDKRDVKDGFIAAAMGLMFSVDSPTRQMEAWEQKIIDNFFDSLEWSTTSGVPKVKEVPYGDLMMMVDMNNRWTYKGSVTTPPCAQNVYWNVLRTVYPITQKHLDLFKSQMARGSHCNNVNDVLLSGNNRIIQNFTSDHNPFIISDGADLSDSVRKSNLLPESFKNRPLAIDYLTEKSKMISLNEVSLKLAKESIVELDTSSEYLTSVITVLLIIAIIFLLLAVVIVTKNSFSKPTQYSGVEQSAAPTERAS